MPTINLADVSLSKLRGYRDFVSVLSKYRLSREAQAFLRPSNPPSLTKLIDLFFHLIAMRAGQHFPGMNSTKPGSKTRRT